MQQFPHRGTRSASSLPEDWWLCTARAAALVGASQNLRISLLARVLTPSRFTSLLNERDCRIAEVSWFVNSPVTGCLALYNCTPHACMCPCKTSNRIESSDETSKQSRHKQPDETSGARPLTGPSRILPNFTNDPPRPCRSLRCPRAASCAGRRGAG